MTSTISVMSEHLSDSDYHVALRNMSHKDMCRLVRFAPIGHPYFRKGTELNRAFYARFDGFGGMTATMSKEIGYAK